MLNACGDSRRNLCRVAHAVEIMILIWSSFARITLSLSRGFCIQRCRLRRTPMVQTYPRSLVPSFTLVPLVAVSRLGIAEGGSFLNPLKRVHLSSGCTASNDSIQVNPVGSQLSGKIAQLDCFV